MAAKQVSTEGFHLSSCGQPKLLSDWVNTKAVKSQADPSLRWPQKQHCLYCHGVAQLYRCNSFIVDLRHKFTVRNMNEIPVFVQSSELSNRT